MLLNVDFFNTCITVMTVRGPGLSRFQGSGQGLVRVCPGSDPGPGVRIRVRIRVRRVRVRVRSRSGSGPGAGRYGQGGSRKMILCIAIINEGLQARILLAPQTCGSATHVSPTRTGLPCQSKFPRYHVLVVPRMQGGNDAACRRRCCSTCKFELPKS